MAKDKRAKTDDALEHAARCEAARLEAWANRLEGFWYNATAQERERFAGQALLPITDSLRCDIAAYLRGLAGNSQAIYALVSATPPRAPRGRKPKPTWCAVLEFELRRREGKFDIVSQSVGRKWQISRSKLTAAWKANRERTPENQRLGGWRYWANYEIRTFRAGHRGGTPAERRERLIEHLRAL